MKKDKQEKPIAIKKKNKNKTRNKKIELLHDV